MKKVVATLFVLGAAYFFTPTSAMADGVAVRIGFGFPPPVHRVYFAERPRREVIVEHPYWQRDGFYHRDWDHDRWRENDRRGRDDWRR